MTHHSLVLTNLPYWYHSLLQVLLLLQLSLVMVLLMPCCVVCSPVNVNGLRCVHTLVVIRSLHQSGLQLAKISDKRQAKRPHHVGE